MVASPALSARPHPGSADGAGPRPPGVILAGGRARRMGGSDKALLPLAGRRLVDHVVGRLSRQCGALALSANGAPARFADLGVPVLPDALPGFPGPLAGLLAGLDWAAAGGADRIVTAPVDTPFLPDDLVARLAAAAGDAGLALAATAGRWGPRLHPTCGLWPVALRHDLRAALAAGERRVADWAARHGAATATFAAGRVDPFFNVNTPEDLAAAEALLAAGA